MPAQITVTTFGYLHGDAPDAHLTVDLRTHFRDPHIDPALRHLDARDPQVCHAVLSTPGIIGLIHATLAAVRAYQHGPTPADVRVAVGCAGGRHRAAVVGAALAVALGHDVRLTHRDLDKPVVERTAPRPAWQRAARRATIVHVRLAAGAVLLALAAAIWLAAH